MSRSLVRSPFIVFVGWMITATPLSAQRESVAVFHLPRDWTRGRAGERAVLSGSQQVEIYRALLTSLPDPPVAVRAWLASSLVSDDGGFALSDSLPEPVLRGILSSGSFRGACQKSVSARCEDRGGLYMFSRIYEIEPGAVRVFVAYIAGP